MGVIAINDKTDHGVALSSMTLVHVTEPGNKPVPGRSHHHRMAMKERRRLESVENARCSRPMDRDECSEVPLSMRGI